MDNTYPPRPEGVPADIASPGPAYMRHAWAAALGLALFLALYFGLMGWLGLISYRWLSAAFLYGGDAIKGVFLSLPALFLLAMLAKGLFYVRRGSNDGLTELSEADEPELIAFIHKVADDTGAARPHRVFLSPRVNAGVFYDLSLADVLLPTRKNLEIGLGLVNSLSLDEFKAVLAHEFGHFAQRSMRVGTWVYLSQQFVEDLLSRRDGFDKLLLQFSYIDLRISWIAWIMRVVVWALRSVLDTAFRGVLLLQRALSREMEFQADLVSVSASGSDSLVHALHKLGAADMGLARAMDFGLKEARAGRPVADVFAIQSRVIERHARVINDPDFGCTPARPERGPEGHRLFDAAIADVPTMWRTHPPNHEREENAKRRYVPSVLDPRSPWLLFQDPAALRARMSRSLYAGVKAEPVPIEESLARLDTQFDKAYLNRRYQGAFLFRSLSLHAARADALLPEPQGGDRAAVLARLDALYPASLSDQLQRMRELEEEKAAMEALKQGVLQAPGGVLRHRGRQIHRRELGGAVEEVARELHEVLGQVHAEDQRARAAHIDAAALLGGGWADYLRGLIRVVHFAEHGAREIWDLNEVFAQELRVALADGKVSSREMGLLIRAGEQLQRGLDEASRSRASVKLDTRLTERLGGASWGEQLEKLKLGLPSQEGFGDWLEAAGSWVEHYLERYNRLSAEARELLVVTEAEVEAALREGAALGDAPVASSLPGSYPTRCTGQERERSAKLTWWDRFQLADGPLAGAARFAVASAVLLPPLVSSAQLGGVDLHIYNGLGRDVVVEVNGEPLPVSAGGTRRVEVPPGRVSLHTTTSTSETIEALEIDPDRSFGDAVYNVAGAGALMRWTAVYGSRGERQPEYLGAPRWTLVDADYVFREPPSQVRTKSDGAMRTVVSRVRARSTEVLRHVSAPEEAEAMIRAHVRWDEAADVQWLQAATVLPDGAELLAARYEAGDRSLPLSRARMDIAEGAARDALCAELDARAEAAPSDPDARYLSVRCMPDSPEQDAAFIAGHRQWPEHPWLAWAAAHALLVQDDFVGASEAFSVVVRAGDERSLQSMAASRLFRLRRLLDPEGALQGSADLLDVAPELDVELLVLDDAREDERTGSPLAAIHVLHDGRLPNLKMIRQLSEVERRHVLVLMALAGRGGDAVREEALAALAEPEGLSPLTLAPALSLAAREGLDLGPILAAHGEASGLSAELIAALGDPRALVADRARIEALARVPNVEVRGLVRLLGVTVLGSKAPPEWLAEAKAFLPAHALPWR